MHTLPPQRETGINWRACLLCCGVNLLGVTAFILLSFIVPGLTTAEHQAPPLAAVFTAAILVCPIAETCLFFWLPYRLLTAVFKQSDLKWVLFFLFTISTFTLTHYSYRPSLYLNRSLAEAFITGTLGGACCATCFYLTKRKGNKNAFWTTTTCHFLYNSVIFFCDVVMRQAGA